MNIGNLYDELLSLVNEHQSGRNYKPDRFNIDIPFVASSYLKTRYGLDENPQAPQYFEKTQKVSDDLSYLKVALGENGVPLMQFDSTGKATKPSDYWHYVSGRYEDVTTVGCQQTPKWRGLIPVTVEERDKMIISPIQRPTHKNPVITVFGTYLQVDPVDIGYANVTYLRKMLTPFYDYDIVNDVEVFLRAGATHVNSSVMPVGSLSRTVDLELPDDCYDDVVAILLQRAGIRMQSPTFYNAGAERKITGQ